MEYSKDAIEFFKREAREPVTREAIFSDIQSDEAARIFYQLDKFQKTFFFGEVLDIYNLFSETAFVEEMKTVIEMTSPETLKGIREFVSVVSFALSKHPFEP
jgi:hypothetical protein